MDAVKLAMEALLSASGIVIGGIIVLYFLGVTIFILVHAFKKPTAETDESEQDLRQHHKLLQAAQAFYTVFDRRKSRDKHVN